MNFDDIKRIHEILRKISACDKVSAEKKHALRMHALRMFAKRLPGIDITNVRIPVSEDRWYFLHDPVPLIITLDR